MGLSSGTPSPQVQHRTVTLPPLRTIASPQYQQHPSMDERERREINSSTMGFEEAIDLDPIDLNTSWTSRTLRGVTTWRRCSGSPMEKVQQEVGGHKKCQNFGTNFKFCQNRELRADYLEVKLFSSKGAKMGRHDCEPFLLFNNKRLSWE